MSECPRLAPEPAERPAEGALERTIHLFWRSKVLYQPTKRSTIPTIPGRRASEAGGESTKRWLEAIDPV
jgi:hypothetical protein